MTTLQAILAASETIARRDAETLLLHIVGRNRAWLLAHAEAPLNQRDADRFRALVERRAVHVPLQYLVGQQEFFGLDLRVGPEVLIPRPETELLVEAVLNWHKMNGLKRSRIVDVGTGSGAIALALAAHLPEAEIAAVDLSAAALELASGNAERLGLRDRVRFLRSDLLQSLDLAGLDVVVSNPPYVPLGDLPEMQPEVRDFEPHLALFAGNDGLSVYRRLIPEAFSVLRSGGLLALEIGFGQQKALETLLAVWDAVSFFEDYAGIPRVVLASRP